MKFHFDDKYKAQIIQQVQTGRMGLFLGAGFSYSANNYLGKTVPIGTEIAQKLAGFAGLTLKVGRPLSRVYDAAVTTKGKHEVNEFLRIQYSGCQATWQKIIPNFLWKRIYTTNIDDVLTSALNKSKAPIQNFEYINFNDLFMNPREIDVTQVIHLHGYVRKYRSGFIFGGKEYATAYKENLSWHIQYSEDYASGGILFVGSQLLESDLELYTLYRSGMGIGKKSETYDSFLVLPDVDDVLITAMAGNNIGCIEATAEEFFEWLDDNVKQRLRRSDIIAKQMPDIVNYTSEKSRNAYIRFKNQFHQLREDESFVAPNHEIHDFFSGDMPDWWDIQQDNDAILTAVDTLVQSLMNDVHVVVAKGSAGCGKTTVLMRTAYKMLNKGWQVYYFEDENQIDVDSAKLVLKSIKDREALVVVDNAADNVEQVNKLIAGLGLLSPDNKLKLKFLMAERDNRLLRVSVGLKLADPVYKDIDSLKVEDIKMIIAKLEEKDKLKKLRGKSKEEQIEFFEQYANKQLLVAMRELAYGARFDDIIANEYKSLSTVKARRIYAAVALCHSQRHSVSIDVLCRAFIDEMLRDDIESMVNKNELIKVVIHSKDNRLITRHVAIAQYLLKSSKLADLLTRKQKADLLTRLMKALAPVVNIKELVRGSAEAMLAKAFMDYDHIENVFGDDKDSIEKYFTELKPLYEWNSKYWAQRALFESKRKRFADAIDFANFAVAKDNHWTIRSAAGLVFLRASCATDRYDYGKAKEFLEDGIAFLEGVIAETGCKDRKSIITLFSILKTYALAWGDIDNKKPFETFEKHYKEATFKWNLPVEYYEEITRIRSELFKKILKI